MLKRWIKVLSLLAVLSLFAAACGSSDSDSTDSGSSTASASAASDDEPAADEDATEEEAAEEDTQPAKKKPRGGGFLTERKAAEAELPRAKTSVLVLNGSGTSGGAQEAAARREVKNYRIVGINNAPHPDYTRTLVLYRNGFKGEAERLARDLGLGWKRVAPMDGMKRRELGKARVVLILGG